LVERGVEEFEEEIRELEAIRASIRAGRKDFKTYSIDEVLADVGLTRMDIGMAPESKETAKRTSKVSSAKNPKKVGVAKAKPESKAPTNRTK
jgi:hypothetical protein